MAKFNERLKLLRNDAGLSQQEFAKRMGVSKSSINMYERGEREPGLETLEAIADYFNVDMDYLLGKSEYKNKSAWLKTVDINANQTDDLSKYFNAQKCQPQALLPVVGIVSAGKGVFAEEEIIAQEPADLKYCKNNEYYWLQVHGDSMSPRISDGDLVLVRRQTSVDPGDIGVFLVDEEEGFIKKVNYSENYIILQSLNPFYPPMEFRGADVQRVRVLGKAIELKAKLN